jgi:hypothetical protein
LKHAGPLPAFPAPGSENVLQAWIPIGKWFASARERVRKELLMKGRSWSILPNTALGRWSVVLIIAMPLLFTIGSSFTDTLYESVPAGGTIPDDIAARPALALTMLAGMAAGVAACITGTLALGRYKEKSLLVYISSIIGALFIVYLAAEIGLPH